MSLCRFLYRRLSCKFVASSSPRDREKKVSKWTWMSARFRLFRKERHRWFLHNSLLMRDCYASCDVYRWCILVIAVSESDLLPRSLMIAGWLWIISTKSIFFHSFDPVFPNIRRISGIYTSAVSYFIFRNSAVSLISLKSGLSNNTYVT